ncbi:hypothetical protein A2V82_11545 [candidate division KSB1 bacterium RBG_16_48_16]|nr:MAG: hypothetical protein A2V82_11545 [candidate division KSB1 bacterium RBG_16_48_16]
MLSSSLVYLKKRFTGIEKLTSRFRTTIFAILLVNATLSHSSLCLAQSEGSDFRFANSSVMTRLRGMGNAFTAVVDKTSAGMFNPALIGFIPRSKPNGFSILINPAETFSGIRQYDDLAAREQLNGLDWLNAAGLVVRSVSFSHTVFRTSLILSEPLSYPPSYRRGNDFIDLSGLLDWNFGTLATSLQLAQQVAIGAAVYLITADGFADRRRSYGSSYGVALQPTARLTIGMAYSDLNNDVALLFQPVDRIFDETINIGISYKPIDQWLLALDIRNASDDQKPVQRELHVGTELSLGSLLAIRSGMYRIARDKNVYSVGLGVLPADLLYGLKKYFHQNEFLLNYSLCVENFGDSTDYKQYLMLSIRI